jgi:hypothetical protein
MLKFAFKDVSTKNSEPTYWTILFVMLKIYFIYKVAGKKSNVMLVYTLINVFFPIFSVRSLIKIRCLLLNAGCSLTSLLLWYLDIFLYYDKIREIPNKFLFLVCVEYQKCFYTRWEGAGFMRCIPAGRSWMPLRNLHTRLCLAVGSSGQLFPRRMNV